MSKDCFILILTHGVLAREICATAADIMGKQENLRYYCIDRSKTAGQIRSELDNILTGLFSRGNVLVLTDMLGGTPTNMTFPYIGRPEIEVITGVNLPMLISALSLRRTASSIAELAETVEKKSIGSIVNLKKRAGEL